jgi:hypothetical protein
MVCRTGMDAGPTGRNERMRMSLDRKVGETALAALEAARGHAADLIDDSAEGLAGAVDLSADRLGADIERWSSVLPTVSVEVRSRYRRRRFAITAAIALVGALAIVLVRRILTRETVDPAPVAFEGWTDELASNGSKPDAAPGTLPTFTVSPTGAGGWDVTGPDGPLVESHHDTQAAGIERAHELLEGSGGEIIICGVDGRPRDTRAVKPHHST